MRIKDNQLTSTFPYNCTSRASKKCFKNKNLNGVYIPSKTVDTHNHCLSYPGFVNKINNFL